MTKQRLDLRDPAVLAELRNAFGQFGEEVRLLIIQVRTEALRAKERLEERVLFWQRRLEAARREFQSAELSLRQCQSSGTRDTEGRYHALDCGAQERDVARARASLRDCEQKLKVAREWRGKVEIAVTAYERDAARLANLVGDHNAQAIAYLQQLQVRYEAVHYGEVLKSDLAGLEPISDEQICQLRIRDSLEEQVLTTAVRLMRVEDARSAKWAMLNQAQRLECLQKVEAYAASALGRAPLRVLSASLTADCLGFYDGVAITINSKALNNSDPNDVVDTVLHEGRHAYQHYAVDHPGVHPDSEAVEGWRQNLQNYLDPTRYGFRLYSRQSVEKDARAHASRITTMLYGNGEKSK